MLEKIDLTRKLPKEEYKRLTPSASAASVRPGKKLLGRQNPQHHRL